ncbi:J domain-containing protein [Azospirillum agricola]|uniref:hypothetical protein n=1 Tax=Azospirillum agricola TaxID=1720247 RepID=UPI000A0F1B98|nr:hypothetical protein [Azospirillum agricola]SMH57830.1 hypothetical protein SAMN02982994_4415 [Azospirillum lipoferum]
MTVPDGLSCDAPDEPDTVLPSGRGLPCGARLAGAVRALAAAKRTDPSALALAALLLVPDGACDPGECDVDGRVTLPLRPVVTATDSAVRRALAAAVALADPAFRIVPAADVGRLEAAVETLGYRNKTLAHALKRLSFQPLDGRVTELRDAVQMFGFVNEWCFDEEQVRRRFRELAPVYHPDTGVVACRERMAQLIDARNLLVRHVRTVYGSGAWMEREPAR